MSKGCKLSIALAVLYAVAVWATYKDLGELSTIGAVIAAVLSFPLGWIAWLAVGGGVPFYVAAVVNLVALGYSLPWTLPLCSASRYREWIENSQRRS